MVSCQLVRLTPIRLSHLLTCTTESRESELKVSAPTERTVLSEVRSHVTCKYPENMSS